MKKVLIGVFTFCLVAAGVLLFFQGQHVISWADNQQKLDEAFTQNADTSLFAKNKDATCQILAGGDIVFHPITYGPDYQTVMEPYDFSHMLVRMQPYFAENDYNTITYETVSNPEAPYTGYPMFNTPPEAISVLHEAGIDAFLTSTNHALDSGLSGLQTTLQKMDEVGVDRFGCRMTPDENIHIVDLNGIQVAFLNYSDAFNGLDQGLAAEDRLLLSPLEMDQVIKDIQKAKEEADAVVVHPHWGIEYQTLPSDVQVDWAHQMVDAGADLVIGSHPHVLQPAEWVEKEDGKRHYIVYSLGNAMSNQRKEFLGTIDTEIGGFLQYSLEKKNGETAIQDVEFLPSTVYINRENGRMYYETVLLQDLIDGRYSQELTEAERNYAKQLKARADEIMGQTIPKVA